MKKCYGSYFSLCCDKHFSKRNRWKKQYVQVQFSEELKNITIVMDGGLNVRCSEYIWGKGAQRVNASLLSLLPLFCLVQELIFRPAFLSSTQPL